MERPPIEFIIDTSKHEPWDGKSSYYCKDCHKNLRFKISAELHYKYKSHKNRVSFFNDMKNLVFLPNGAYYLPNEYKNKNNNKYSYKKPNKYTNKYANK